MDVEEDFAVWKEYARRRGLHGAIVSYLDIKRENFYRIETTVDGIQFATARGWEDLSELIYAYEKLGLPVGREVVEQYIQLPRIARDFAGYLELYSKYQRTYRVEEILAGKWTAAAVTELRTAPFDEKLSVLGLLLSRLSQEAGRVRVQDALTDALHTDLTALKARLAEGTTAGETLHDLEQSRREAMERSAAAGQLDRERRTLDQREMEILARYRQNLLDGDIADKDAMPVMVIGLKGSDLASLQSIADDTISPALERIEGVASVDVEGGYKNEIAVETYTEKLEGYGLSLSYIAQILSAENVAIPAGSVDNGANTLSVRTDGEFSSAEDVANCLIPLPTGGSVRLGEVANVYLKPQERSTIARVDGEDCVVLSVNKQSDVNTVTTARSVQAAMADIAKENPSLSWSVLMDQSDYINQSVESAITNIILGVLLAALVLFLFLRDWGATMVISVSMAKAIEVYCRK